jgi:type IX secretion system PorP/SprF family membrane protein
MNKRFIAVISIFWASLSIGQDIHFTQSSQTPLWINPAITGVYDGWERVIVNHRNQWLGSNTQFMTTAVSADINLMKTRSNDKAHIGLGVFLWNDVGGDAKFGTRQGQLSISGILPMGNGHQLSAGLQGGLGNRGGNMSALYFENQWTGEEFNQDLPSFEADRLQSDAYFSISTGVNYQFDNKSTKFAHDEVFRFQLGAAIYHANKPDIKYFGLVNESLNRKFVFHTSVLKDLPGSQWTVDGSFVQFIQGPHYQSLLGLMMRYRMNTGGKITTFKQDAFVAFGLYSRFGDAIAPAFMLELKGFQFGISYDFTVSPLRNTHSGGSLEFSLAYRNLYHALFKKRRR